MHEHTHKRRAGVWRQIALLLLFLGISVSVVLGFTNPSEFASTMASAAWSWMIVSVLLFALSFYLWAWLYRLGLAAAGVEVRTSALLGPVMVSIFLNTAAPVGEAVFVDYAIEHGQSGAKAAAGTILALAVDLGTTVPFIIAGLVFLRSEGKMPLYYVVVSAMFVFVVLLMFGALWAARVRPARLEAALRWSQRTLNRVARLFKRRERELGTWAGRSAQQFSEAAAYMAGRRGVLVLGVLVGLLFHAINAAGLYTLCLAFGQKVSLGTVTAAFSMSVVLYVIAVTPQGVGPTEGVMALLLTNRGAGSAVAVVIALTYRIFNIWVPILIGYLVARRMRIFGGRAMAPDHNPE